MFFAYLQKKSKGLFTFAMIQFCYRDVHNKPRSQVRAGAAVQKGKLMLTKYFVQKDDKLGFTRRFHHVLRVPFGTSQRREGVYASDGK